MLNQDITSKVVGQDSWSISVGEYLGGLGEIQIQLWILCHGYLSTKLKNSEL